MTKKAGTGGAIRSSNTTRTFLWICVNFRAFMSALNTPLTHSMNGKFACIVHKFLLYEVVVLALFCVNFRKKPNKMRQVQTSKLTRI